MVDLEQIFSGDYTSTEIIERLKQKALQIPLWSYLVKLFEETLHDIITNDQTRRDKVRSDGTIDKASRIPIGLEKLLTKRVNEFTFAIPVRRVYSNIDDNETRKSTAKASE